MSETVTETVESGTPANGSVDSLTVQREAKPWQFQKGQPSRNPHGRPRKGESLPERLAREYDKRQKQLIDAAIKRALRDDQVGNRAFNDGLDRVYGKVADEMHITTGEQTPVMAWLQRLSGEVVDGESRVVPDTEDTGETT
jgi:hypothetical protein